MLFVAGSSGVARGEDRAKAPIYVYALAHEGGQWSYDEAMAVASLQGLINRDSPELFVLSRKNARAQYWLDLLSKDGRWLDGRERKPLADVTAIVKLAGPRVKGAVIWDPAVPATANVATTVAAVHDAVVLSPELADRYLSRWKLPVVLDLRGTFTGAETGSRKNDAYRWAIREYLAKGRCSSHLLCLFEDSYTARSRGDIGYVVTRDWAAKNRAFVFDLSPWADEKPGDDPDQKLGTDAQTYQMILAEAQRQAAGRHMTEVTGFFAMSKYSNQADHRSSHEPVPTEWESVWIMSPYNCYQNTISSDCLNQSFHSHAPRKPLKQRRDDRPITLDGDKTYVAILMADYDSATPLFDFLPEHWHDPGRGALPLAWGINPNLLECYPDLIAYRYATATPNDTFTSDASCAGYINPSRIAPQSLPLFVRHNQQLFREADMTIAPMVLDRDQPTPAVKDAFAQFAPDGYATIVADVLGGRGTYPPPQVWKGMPILELFNDTCNSKDPAHAANAMSAAIARFGGAKPGFFLFRHVWVSPTHVADSVAALKKAHPEWNVEVVDVRTLFALFKQSRDAKR
jgi:hypothetical protein